MKMSQSDGARLSRISQKQMQEQIDKLAAKYRPDVIRTYDENGNMVKVIGPAFAEGARGCQHVKSTSRNGYSL